ncbi:NAD-dependent epimerase/dehydratase family protein [Nocardia sp. ET3-3]|uniref:NAD-dependent epimerase/dehydratase family protein n=1 Tax=Nocardia terrae TaxID=2675851 RepID=A0A7K1V9U0_9NOCA|nr:NAD(P)-dependent oxidoreductase [Nocardia terrae]MVU83413.1 NAD-dependent epimerase/dehydratase family protein [Nocardia terrae]
MDILVAGASGAIGTRLIPQLLDAGHKVIGTSRTESGARRLRETGAGAVVLDVFDKDAVEQSVEVTAPDVIIHQLTALNGGTSHDNARIRRVGTRNLVDAARKAGVERIVAQSIAWAYEPGSTPAAESTPLDLSAPEPRSVTIGGIRTLEEAVAELPHHVVLRYGTLYGPGTWYHADGLAAEVLRGDSSALGGLPANDGVSSFVHVEDAARAAVEALNWPNGIVNIVDDEPAPAWEWMPVLAAAVGVAAPVRTAGGARWERGATNTLARSLGWTPRWSTWRTGFRA